MTIDLDRQNPLGLKVLAFIPHNITKSELARQVMPQGMEYDFALPQEWLNAFTKGNDVLYDRLLCQCVCAYPAGSVFGVIVNLFTGAIYQ